MEVVCQASSFLLYADIEEATVEGPQFVFQGKALDRLCEVCLMSDDVFKRYIGRVFKKKPVGKICAEGKNRLAEPRMASFLGALRQERASLSVEFGSFSCKIKHLESEKELNLTEFNESTVKAIAAVSIECGQSSFSMKGPLRFTYVPPLPLRDINQRHQNAELFFCKWACKSPFSQKILPITNIIGEGLQAWKRCLDNNDAIIYFVFINGDRPLFLKHFPRFPNFCNWMDFVGNSFVDRYPDLGAYYDKELKVIRVKAPAFILWTNDEIMRNEAVRALDTGLPEHHLQVGHRCCHDVVHPATIALQHHECDLLIEQLKKMDPCVSRTVEDFVSHFKGAEIAVARMFYDAFLCPADVWSYMDSYEEPISMTKPTAVLGFEGLLDLSDIVVSQPWISYLKDEKITFADIDGSICRKTKKFYLKDAHFNNGDLPELIEFVKLLENVEHIDVSENMFFGKEFKDWIIALLDNNMRVTITGNPVFKVGGYDFLRNLTPEQLEKLTWLSRDMFHHSNWRKVFQSLSNEKQCALKIAATEKAHQNVDEA